jgi:hypothetical protein
MNTFSFTNPSAPQLLNAVSIFCYWTLKIIGWLAVSSACVISLNVIFFVLLGNFTLEGMFLQIDNFGSRYIEAGAARRADFIQLWLTGNTLILAVTCLLRRHSLLANTFQSKEI